MNFTAEKSSPIICAISALKKTKKKQSNESPNRRKIWSPWNQSQKE
jgi:hypothetical protein